MYKKLFFVLSVLFALSSAVLFAQEAAAVPEEVVVAAPVETAAEAEVSQPAANENANAVKFIAAALAVGLACIAGGIAVGKIGSAAMGAMAENAELSGKALPFVGLAEGICLWGFLVGLLIIIL